MRISFDPFEVNGGLTGTVSPEVRMKGGNNRDNDHKQTNFSKQLRNLDSPKSV